MNEEEEKTDGIPLRTISSYCSYNKQTNNLLNFMSHEAKNIYNTSIFLYQIFLTYKQQIFRDLYFMLKNNEIEDVYYFDGQFYNVFHKYRQKYIKLKYFRQYNNNLIYRFIKETLDEEEVILVNNNFFIIEKYIINTLENENLLKFPKKCSMDDKREIFYDIVRSILKSIYDKNFNQTKEEILEKTKCTIDDKIFIEQVRNNEYIIPDYANINYKNMILKEFEMFQTCGKDEGLKADMTYLFHIVSIYYINPKIPPDLMSRVITKAYSTYTSFFGARKKGIKARIPKFLPKDGHYVLTFFINSFTEAIMKNHKQIGVRKPQNKYKKPRKNKQRTTKRNTKRNVKKKSRKNGRANSKRGTNDIQHEELNKNWKYYRLTVGKNTASNYIDIIDNNNYVCINLNENTEYKKYVNKKYLNVIEPNQQIAKTYNYIIGNHYINKKSAHIIDAYYIYIKKPNKIPSDNIKTIEIIPLYERHRYKINFTYVLEKSKNKPDNEKELSCDLGMINLITVYDPNGEQYIIKGNVIRSLNCYYNKKINKLKSQLAKQGKTRYKSIYDKIIGKYGAIIEYIDGQNPNYVPVRKTQKYPDTAKLNKQINCVLTGDFSKYEDKKQLTSKRIRNLLIEREHRINQYFNKIVSWFVKKYKNCARIIVGYNKGWKQNVNMGRKTNRDFYEIPYAKLLKKLRWKLEENNQELIEINEAYTSKCDALALEYIEKHEKYLGKREKRGLFKSSTGVLINADLNGAINIMRKWRERQGKPMKKITGKGLFNPKIVHIVSYDVRKSNK